jgi:hypothetical protein
MQGFACLACLCLLSAGGTLLCRWGSRTGELEEGNIDWGTTRGCLSGYSSTGSLAARA